jgi:hypothetical protein
MHDMHRALFYREQAERARRLAGAQTQGDTKALLNRVAQEYDELAEDLENGGVEIRHPELLPQRNH